MEKLFEAIDNSHNITVLTGAGVSTSSGIPDFQNHDSEWPFQVSRNEATTVAFLRDHPKEFWEIYRYIFSFPYNVEPTKFHRWLVDLEQNHTVNIITQNIDGLHEKAGSSHVIPVHGSTEFYRCGLKHGCGSVYPSRNFDDVAIPRCPKDGKLLRPQVVLFGDRPKNLGTAKKKLRQSDMLIIAGTSMNVLPVGGFSEELRNSRPQIPQVWLNQDEPPSNVFVDAAGIGKLDAFEKDFRNWKTPHSGLVVGKPNVNPNMRRDIIK